MEARIVTMTAKPGSLDPLASFWSAERVEEITKQAGSRGFVLLKDVDNGRLIGLSLWDTGADADATGPTFRSHMEAVAEHLAGPPAPVRCEVAASSAGVLTR